MYFSNELIIELLYYSKQMSLQAFKYETALWYVYMYTYFSTWHILAS